MLTFLKVNDVGEGLSLVVGFTLSEGDDEGHEHSKCDEQDDKPLHPHTVSVLVRRTLAPFQG